MFNKIFILLVGTILLTQAGCVSQRSSLHQAQSRADWVEDSPELRRYDKAFIEPIQTHWDKLVEKVPDHLYSSGKVVLQFRLHHDGRVTDLVVLESLSKEMDKICQKAILDPSPHGAWPKKIREKFPELSREVTFTFQYQPLPLDGSLSRTLMPQSKP